MAHQSLYRRYRSQRFSEVRGQDTVVNALRSAVADERVGHAYLFSGPRGTGKTSTARILAKALNCEDLQDGEPCTVCASCVAMQAGTSYDLQELDAASNNKVEDVRALIERVALGSPGRTKVYILDEVHMLSPGASNALLKTLEEPPDHVVFVLATTDPQKVLPTIRSRTQHFEFHLLPADVMEDHVRWVIADAGLDVDEAAVEHVLRAGGGSARDTLSFLDQAAAGGVSADGDHAEALAEAVVAVDTGAALSAVATATIAGRDPRVLGEALLAHLRDVFLLRMGGPLGHLSETARARVEGWAGRVTDRTVTRALEEVGEALLAMRQAPDPRIPLEVALVRITRAAPAAAGGEGTTGLDELVARIERLEAGLAGLAAGAPPSAVAPPPGAPAPAAVAPPTGAPTPAPAPAATEGTRPAPEPDPGPAGASPAPGPAAAGSAPAPGAADVGSAPASGAGSGAPSGREAARAAARQAAGAKASPPPPRRAADPPPPPPARRPEGPPAGAADPPPPPPARRPDGPPAASDAAAPGGAPGPADPAPTGPTAGTSPAAAPSGSAAPAAAAPAPDAGEPATAPAGGADLRAVWAERVVPSLRGAVAALLRGVEDTSAEGDVLTVRLPNQFTVDRVEKERADIEAALGTAAGRPARLRLEVATDRADRAPSSAGPSRRPDPADDPVEVIDPDELVDAPAQQMTGVDRVTEAFPGAQVVDP